MISPDDENGRIVTGRPVVGSEPSDDGMSEGQRRILFIGIGVGALVILAGLIAAAVYLGGRPALAATVRDIFIILMGLVFLLIGAAMVILIVQLAVLTNMLQHEIKPILQSTNETVSTVRGTTAFLSENLVEPVIKLNSYLAALSQVVETLGVFGRSRRKK
jgi:hypothetical protein